MTPELLAPAGTVPAFEAALDAGADAVYLGVPAFNARALARDFSFAELAAMIAFAHERGRRVHLAMNSLVKEDELPQALAVLERAASMGPDALIVQDPALARAARREFPELPLHASTLMTAHNSLAVRFLAGRGFRRVVLGRELSLAEIGPIAETARQARVELEVFIHGAMCFCYSGLCRFSSLHGGKSSLRGQCVQPCRRRFQWVAGGKAGGGDRNGGYFFSMNDLNGLNQVAELAALGVTALKIEGRLKSVAYVRATVRAYRLALDAFSADGARRAAMLQEARALLSKAMGRRSSSGFFAPGAAAGPGLINPGQAGASGTPVGHLAGWDRGQGRGANAPTGLLVRLTADIRQGDRLRLHEEGSDTRIAFTLRDFQAAGMPRKTARAGEIVTIRVGGPDFTAWRPPSGKPAGRLYRVDVSGRRERVGPELAKLIARLQADPQIARPPLPNAPEGEQTVRRRSSQAQKIHWWLRVAAWADLRLRTPFPTERQLLNLTPENLDQALAARRTARDGSLVWALPAVIPEERLAWCGEALARLREAGFRAFQLGQAAQLELFAGRDDLELFGDASLNPLNHEALAALFALGFRGLQFSLETDRATLAAALAAGGASPKRAVGLYAYGRPALFTARAESPHFRGRHALESPRGERYVIRKQEQGLTVHPHIPFSLLAHAGELAELGVDYLVLDLTGGHPSRELTLAAALLRERPGKGLIPHFTGNYRGVLA